MPRPGHDEVVLINGFPSLYAQRITEHVLSTNPRAFVYVVVRAEEKVEADRALVGLGEAEATRTRVLEGDPAAMDLGLSGPEYRQLASEVDRIHHAAHAAWVGMDEATAARANVATTAEILELARASSSLEALVVHSTAAVSGDRTGVVYEEDLEAGQEFHDEAARARMRAEALARRASKTVPIVIVRPGAVVGASGPEDRLDVLHLAALLALTTPAEIPLPLPQRGEVPVHVVPMEYVVRASCALGRMPEARGKTFHLVDPHPIAARRFFEVLGRAARGSNLRQVPASSAAMLLRTPGIERFVRSPKTFLEQIARGVRYDARAAMNALAGTGITCAPFEAYAEELVREVEEHVTARRAPRPPSSSPGGEAEVYDPFS
ncbi:SDR family oxidoreductase [Polyangium jinanense]|uniref:SDR family oxidoreductase n=1 Tax=Polyangium jinanense TaxID=2829994 RepID=A0A9X3XIR0_9BACT|nr:SDR family oxidoreductase [Polyangium jinanense]MDC3989433.1 SDR family oxidoreductase [Polyangium jinanense]